DFLPIEADFGAAIQEFHIGMGSVATPGIVAGCFAVHDDLGSLPMTRLIEPAVLAARRGVALASLQSFILDTVGPIYQWSEESRRLYHSRRVPGQLLQPGERRAVPALADTLEALAREGPRLFYEGEIADAIVRVNIDGGGALDQADLSNYQVARRQPLRRDFAGAEILGNPAPSSGGPLIAFALALLEDFDAGRDESERLHRVARAMALTDRARRHSGLSDDSHDDQVAKLLSEAFMADYRAEMPGRAGKVGGTTHISVIDGMGNTAALSVSNGEGCGHVLPIGGIMLNNMLGEEDLNPNGFFQWCPDSRITSMMSPTVVRGPGGRLLALGSGGSNRIRSAILQTLLNTLRLDLDLADAVAAPRIHLERDLLNIEGGFAETTSRTLTEAFNSHKVWPDRNFFFGGVHAAAFDPETNSFEAAGDPRRGGHTMTVGGPGHGDC
ncbi:MAG: gamma-glutamyltransferase, partial [Alphaproteobacteria bacterium]|nr:gamma-glutamyltransferase [Alphaproteobacteria bacterium]